MSTIVDIFLDIKKKLDQSSQQYLSKILPFDEDRDSLQSQESIILLQYIKQVVVFLVKSKLELEDKLQHNNSNEYEVMVQKLEADIRTHIRVEQQLRLYAESQQSKYEDSQKEVAQLQQHIAQLQVKLNQYSKVSDRAKEESIKPKAQLKSSNWNTDLYKKTEQQIESFFKKSQTQQEENKFKRAEIQKTQSGTRVSQAHENSVKLGSIDISPIEKQQQQKAQIKGYMTEKSPKRQNEKSPYQTRLEPSYTTTDKSKTIQKSSYSLEQNVLGTNNFQQSFLQVQQHIFK